MAGTPVLVAAPTARVSWIPQRPPVALRAVKVRTVPGLELVRVVLHRHRRSSRFLRIKQIQYQRVHHSGGGPKQATAGWPTHWRTHCHGTTVLRPSETTVYRQHTCLLTTWKSLCLAVHQARSGPNNPSAGWSAPGHSSRACPLRQTDRSHSSRRDKGCPRGLSPTPSGRGCWRFMSGQSTDPTWDTEPRAGETCMPERSWKGRPHPCDGRRVANSSRRSPLWTTVSWHGHCK